MLIFAEEVREGDFAYCRYNRIDDVEVEIDESSCCSSPSSSSSSSCHFDPWELDESLCQDAFSYRKLTLDPINLTVLKLDGSLLDIIVSKKATVADLKQAVEDEFGDLFEERIGQVSWSCVWEQFCLCFEDQKLLDDQDSIELYGIEDGDQLQFIRYTSTSDYLQRQKSRKQDSESEKPVKSSSKYHSSWLHIMRRYFLYRNLDQPDMCYQPLSTSDVFEDVP